MSPPPTKPVGQRRPTAPKLHELNMVLHHTLTWIVSLKADHALGNTKCLEIFNLEVFVECFPDTINKIQARELQTRRCLARPQAAQVWAGSR